MNMCRLPRVGGKDESGADDMRQQLKYQERGWNARIIMDTYSSGSRQERKPCSCWFLLIHRHSHRGNERDGWMDLRSEGAEGLGSEM